jgi:predicted nuclease of restriction endonuclease-like (RecB) superfamily
MSELNNIAGLFTEIKNLIDNSRNKVATVVNAEMTMLYWKIGKRINDEIGTQSRAEGYGKQIVATLWRQLSDEYGALFSEKNLRRMMQFAKVFSDETIVVSLIRQLSWTHIIALIPIEDPLKRDFYIEMCKMDKWSVRTLRGRIDSMLFERTAISKKGEETILQDIEALKNEAKLSPDYMLPPVNYVVNDQGKVVFVQLSVQNWDSFVEEYNRLKNLTVFKERLKTAFREIRQIQKGEKKGTSLTKFLNEL